MLVKQVQQRQFVSQNALQAGKVAVSEGLEFGVDQFKQLLSGADIVGEQFKQAGVVHCGLFGVTDAAGAACSVYWAANYPSVAR